MTKFENFPIACCDFTSWIVAKYLHDNGVTNIRNITGDPKHKIHVRHAWLVVCGHTVDLTADQFSDGHIVFWDSHSAWHKKNFKIVKDVVFIPAIELDFHDEAKNDFDNFFREFCKNIAKA